MTMAGLLIARLRLAVLLNLRLYRFGFTLFLRMLPPWGPSLS